MKRWTSAVPLALTTLPLHVFGLVGPSGTGKSHAALTLSGQLRTDCIIDDGLLIYQRLMRAGYSAKFESTHVAATRRALFANTAHRNEVRGALETIRPGSCLVLGTSRNMVQLICNNLGLDGSHITWLDIHTVLGPAELRVARELRARGQHAIPVSQPVVHGSGSIATLVRRVLRHIRTTPTVTVLESMPVVVRPVFVEGSIHIHRRAISDSIRFFLRRYSELFRVRYVHCDKDEDAHFLISLEATWQLDLTQNIVKSHRELCSFLQETMGFPYPQVDIRVESLRPPRQERRPGANRLVSR